MLFAREERNHMRRFLGGSLCAAVVILAWNSVAPFGGAASAQGQSGAYRPPRLAGTQSPNFNGVWQAITTANWDIQDHPAGPGPAALTIGAWGVQPPGKGIVEGNQIPYKPEALAQKKVNVEKRLTVDPQNLHDSADPEAKCYLPGIPRAMYMPYPFQIIQTSDQILMYFGYRAAGRVIALKDHKSAPVPSWMGWSNGRWEGDTLVVEVTEQNGHSWLDRAGNFASDKLLVVERYTATSPDHLVYEATLEDPDTFTRPWKIRFPLYRLKDANVEVLELRCVEFVEDYMYGTLRKKASR
jgi:hypothetical protein